MKENIFKNAFFVNDVEVDADSYAEAFDGKYLRFIITADDKETAKRAAYSTTALPSTVVGRAEGGVEKYLDAAYTPDKRPGVLVQLWMDSASSKESFGYEMSLRIRQGALVDLETAIYDANPSFSSRYDTMRGIGYCGDGFETECRFNGRNMIKIPLMSGEFLIERSLGVGDGVSGGNLWFLCSDKKCLADLRQACMEAIGDTEGAVAPFGLCSAGSKPGSLLAESNSPEREYYRKIGPTTNHAMCPSLKNKTTHSKVPDDIERIPELVINGVDLLAVKTAMRNSIEYASFVDGVQGISAGNYDGKLGRHKIYLKDLF